MAAYALVHEAGCFSVAPDGGSGVKTKKGVCTWLLQTIIYHNLEKKTLFYDCMIYFSVVFFLSKRPVVHRGLRLVRSRVNVDFRHQRHTNLEAQSHPRLIRIAIHLRFRFLRFKEFRVAKIIFCFAIDPETMINPPGFC